MINDSLNVIYQWVNLDKNYNHYFNFDNKKKYFKSNFEFTNSSSEKASILEIFQNSIIKIDEQKDQNTSYDLGYIIKAAKNVEGRFKEAFDKQSLIKKMFTSYFSFSDSSLIGSYHHFMDKLAEVAVSNEKRTLKGWVDTFNSIDGNLNPFEKDFLKRIIRIARKNIEDREDNRGLIYSVTNEKGVTSYLVGTIHEANRHMVENRKIHQIVDESKELIIEVGDNLWVRMMYKMESLNPSNKMKYCVDISMASRAKEREIPISGLETPADQLKIVSRGQSESKNSPDVLSSQVVNRIRDHGPFLKDELIEAWQNGDEKEIQFLSRLSHSKLREAVLDGRNENWLNGNETQQGLLEKLRTADQPICIAVGAFHCKGLVDAFKSIGLEVKRVKDKDERDQKIS